MSNARLMVLPVMLGLWGAGIVSGPAIAQGLEKGARQTVAPERLRLSNGIEVHLIRRTNLPLVQVQLLLTPGDLLKARPGVAQFTMSLIRKGAGSRDATQLADAIDGMGADLDTWASRDELGASISLLKSELASGMMILSDIVQRPRLTSDEFERYRTQTRARLSSALDDPNAVLELAANTAIMGEHPAGQSLGLKSLASLKPDQVKDFHTRSFSPRHARFVVVGDATPAELMLMFERCFGQWRGPEATAVAVPEPRHKPRVVHLVDMNTTQSFIAVGHVAPPRNTPDVDAIRVMNFILGGDFSSRLNQSIRDRQGLAYGAHSTFTLGKHTGTFMATANTKLASTQAVIDAIFAEIQRLHQEPVNPNELSDAHAYLAGSFPMRFETNADLARELRFSLLHQLPWPDPQTYQARIRAVSADHVMAAARQWLRPEDMQIIVVGPAKEIEADLKRFGPVQRHAKQSLIES